MSLYRLDYEHENGTTTPVRSLIGGDYLTSSAKDARERAKQRANDALTPVRVTRISGGGIMRRVLTARPTPRFKS